MKHISDWTAETPESIAARLDGAKASQGQLRVTIIAMSVVAVTMLVAAYNAYFSYDYAWITEAGDGKLGDGWRSEVLTAQALKDWATSRTVQVALLGIRVSVDDAAILGSAVLLVMSLWLFLLARRENHTIGFLLRNTDTPEAEDGSDGQTSPSDIRNQRWIIFHTILANSLFVTCDPALARVTSLEATPVRAASTRLDDCKRSINRAAFALVRYFFFFFPALACLLVFGADRWSYFIADPFTKDFASPPIGEFFWRSFVVFFVCWIPLTICCWRSSQYSRATETVLRAYGRKLGSDLLADASPARPAQVGKSRAATLLRER